MLEPCAALLGAGHAVHLGLTDDVEPDRLTTLWRAWPSLSIGRAVPRRDRWRRLAGELDAADRRRLPPDPGILAYLHQLDLDLLLLATGEAGPIGTDYLTACAGLGVPAADLGPTAEAVLAQAAAGAVAARPRPPATSPELWARLVWSELTGPPESDAPASGADGQYSAVWKRIQEGYARRVFPALVSAAASLAPDQRPLLKASLDERLERSVLDNEISAEAAMAAAAEGQGTVVLGPWWGDPALEILYWAPFLRWWRRRYQVDKERILVVSAGQGRIWYDGVLGRYLDLSELYDPLALADLEAARRQEQEGRNKRFGLTDADRQVFKRLNRRLGFRGLKTLPPWVMGVVLDRYWTGQAGPALLAARTRAQPIRIKEKKARQLFRTLPASFIAVGLEGGEGDPERRSAFEAMILRAAVRTGVVILAEPDEAAAAKAIAARATSIQVIELEARSAKGTASAVLAAARAYVGAPGWMGYAAAALGRPAVCLGPAGERQLIDQASAARLFSPAPIFLGLDEAEAVTVALELIAPARSSVEPAH